jgi:hypothetical protein
MNQTRDGSVEIYINSAVDKTNVNDTLSEWTSYLPIPIEIENNKAYGLSVKSASICNTIPQFHATETKFKLNNTEINIDNDTIFTNTSNLCAYLTTLCDTASIDLEFKLDPKTQRVKVINNTAGGLMIDLSEPYLFFWKKLGFQYDLTLQLPSITIEAGGETLLKYIATLIPTQRVFIICDEVVPNSAYPTDNNRPIIGSIDLMAGYGAYNFTVEPFLYEHDLRFRHAFNSLSFSILDDKYRPIQMRGGSVNLSLVIKRI